MVREWVKKFFGFAEYNMDWYSCDTCIVLRDEVFNLRMQNQLLLDQLIEVVKPKITVGESPFNHDEQPEFKQPDPRTLRWSQRVANIEKGSREANRRTQEVAAKFKEETEKLEREMGIKHESKEAEPVRDDELKAEAQE